MSILPFAGAVSYVASGGPLKTAAAAVTTTGSAFANLLGRAVSKPAANDDAKDEPKQTDSASTANGIDAAVLQNENAQKIQQFAAAFRSALKEEGIEPIGGIELELDALGQVRVAGNPFDKEKIESVLSSHPELGRQFREIAANAGLLRAIDESAKCQQTPDADAHSMVSDAPSLFDKAQAPKFVLNVLPDSVQASM